MTRLSILCVLCLLNTGAVMADASIDCSQCESWNQEQTPFQIFGNSYYVGTHGLSSVLITSNAGHVLIDGALPQSARLIAQHIEQLGFKMSDVKVILNSHVHFDHAGGIAELQRISGAKVVASALSVQALRTGKADASDPQFNIAISYPGSSNVESLAGRDSVDVGSLHLKAIPTPGHTAGGTSWTWQSCEGSRCLNIVYGDSVSAVSDEAFKYGGNGRYANAAADMEKSFAVLGGLSCDILITPHPEMVGLWNAIDEHGKGQRSKLIDSSACKHYAETAKARFDRRIKDESQMK